MRFSYTKLFLSSLFFTSSIYCTQIDPYNQAKQIISRSKEITELESFLHDHNDLIYATDERGNTLLHYAVEKKNKDAVKVLLDKRSDPNAQNNSGFTPLVLAIIAGERGLVSLLLENGASPSKVVALDTSPLTCAAFYGYYDITKSLLSCNKQTLPQQQKDAALITTIREAARKASDPAAEEHKKIIELLIKQGASVQCTNTFGSSCLLLAVNLPKIIKIFLRHGAQVNLARYDGQTPLMESIEKNCPETISLLLAHGANPLLLNTRAENAISLAIKRGQEKGLQKIINTIRLLFGLLAENISEEINEELKQENLIELRYLLAQESVKKFLEEANSQTLSTVTQNLEYIGTLINCRQSKITKIETLHAMFLEILSGALCTAVAAEKINMAKLIIKNIKIVFPEDIYSAYHFPLLKAIDGNHLALTALLIQHGARIRSEELIFVSATGTWETIDLLEYARKRHYLNIARLLLLNNVISNSYPHSALISFENEESLPLLEHAVEVGNVTKVTNILNIMGTPNFQKNDDAENNLLNSIKRVHKLLRKNDLYREILEMLTKKYLEIYQEEILESLEQLFSPSY